MKEQDKHSKCINCGHPIHYYKKKEKWLHDGCRTAYCDYRWDAKYPNRALLGGCLCHNAQPIINEVKNE